MLNNIVIVRHENNTIVNQMKSVILYLCYPHYNIIGKHHQCYQYVIN